MRAGGLSLVVAGIVVGSAGLAADAAIEFQKVTGSFPSFNLGVPSLNDQGVLAFEAPDTGSSKRMIYYGTPAGVQRIDTTGLTVTNGQVSINNAGQIAFAAVPVPDGRQVIDGVYRYNPGGTITTIADRESRVEGLVGAPVINNSGTVAFSVFGEFAQVIAGDGSAPAANRLTIAGGSIREAHIDGAGRAVVVRLPTDGANAIYRDGQNIVSPAAPVFTDPGYGVSGTFVPLTADTSDDGRVVFFGNWTGYTRAMYVLRDDTITKVPGSDGIGLDFNGEPPQPAINDLGTVVAMVSATPGVNGGHAFIWASKDSGSGPIISVGDSFDGSFVTSLAFTPEGLNNLDQIAFRVGLQDGRNVEVVTTVPAPEPGSAGVILAAGVASLLRRRRWR